MAPIGVAIVGGGIFAKEQHLVGNPTAPPSSAYQAVPLETFQAH